MADNNFVRKSSTFEKPSMNDGSKRQKMLGLAVLAVVVIAVVAIAVNRPSGDETETANSENIDDFEFSYDDTNTSADEGEVLGEETSQQPDEETSEDNTAENDQPVAEDNDEEVEKVPEVAKEDVPEATDRDKERVAEIESLRSALKKFFDERKGYPEKMDELTPKYIKDIPKNPTPGGQEYSYTPIGSADKNDVYGYYDLGYTLEVGVNGLSAGLHIANPDGLAFP